MVTYAWTSARRVPSAAVNELGEHCRGRSPQAGWTTSSRAPPGARAGSSRWEPASSSARRSARPRRSSWQPGRRRGGRGAASGPGDEGDAGDGEQAADAFPAAVRAVVPAPSRIPSPYGGGDDASRQVAAALRWRHVPQHHDAPRARAERHGGRDRGRGAPVRPQGERRAGDVGRHRGGVRARRAVDHAGDDTSARRAPPRRQPPPTLPPLRRRAMAAAAVVGASSTEPTTVSAR